MCHCRPGKHIFNLMQCIAAIHKCDERLPFICSHLHAVFLDNQLPLASRTVSCPPKHEEFEFGARCAMRADDKARVYMALLKLQGVVMAARLVHPVAEGLPKMQRPRIEISC